MYDVGVFIIPECESICVVVDLQQTMDWSGFSTDKWRHTHHHSLLDFAMSKVKN